MKLVLKICLKSLFTLFLACGSFAVYGQDIARLEHVATLIRENKTTQAERELATILRTVPNHPLALNLLGTIRAKQNRLAEAETLFTKAVTEEPRYTGARMNLAFLYLQKREPAKAVVQLKEVLTQQPTNTEVMVVLGDAHFAAGALDEAERQYLDALEGRLDNAAALLGLAQISRAKGEIKETTIYLTRVGMLAADSKSPEFLYKFASVALQVGMNDAAKAALENALKLRPNEPAYLLALGVAWLRKGDLFEAEKVFRHMIQLQPASEPAQVHLGYVLLNQKKYDEAQLWLEKSARSASPMPEVFYYLGLVAQEQNDDAKAIQLFEKAVQKLPNYAHARIALGSSYIKMRNYPRAKEELETAVKLDPEEPKAHYNLALLYARLKDTARAQEEMRIVEKLKAKGAGSDGVVVLPPNPNPR
ncbi:MAG TPA: tetratricopeptide repeat protein [Pyrinomonadaceae bacterium]|nr:tetratricopeptide repeat protein [Pyrinomonadaceae bacterium]